MSRANVRASGGGWLRWHPPRVCVLLMLCDTLGGGLGTGRKARQRRAPYRGRCCGSLGFRGRSTGRG